MLYSLVKGLLDLKSRVSLLLTTGTKADQSFDRSVGRHEVLGQLTRHYRPSHRTRFVGETLYTSRVMKETGSARVIFPNYFTAPIPRGSRAVTSILDLQYLHYPEFFSPVKRAWLRVAHELSLRHAYKVTVISDFVRDDLLSRYGRKFESKTVTVPIGIEWRRFAESSPPSTFTLGGRPFILSVASHYAHKNLSTLLRAFARIAHTVPHDLVLVGQRRAHLIGVRHPNHIDLDVLAAELGIAHRVHMTGHTHDGVVAWCYQNASAFAFPSLFEGFGMPVVEALGMGLPVITTRCGSIPEVANGLAALVNDPTDPAELADLLKQVLDRPQGFLPSSSDISMLRLRYEPTGIAKRFLALLD